MGSWCKDNEEDDEWNWSKSKGWSGRMLWRFALAQRQHLGIHRSFFTSDCTPFHYISLYTIDPSARTTTQCIPLSL